MVGTWIIFHASLSIKHKIVWKPWSIQGHFTLQVYKLPTYCGYILVSSCQHAVLRASAPHTLKLCISQLYQGFYQEGSHLSLGSLFYFILQMIKVLGKSCKVLRPHLPRPFFFSSGVFITHAFDSTPLDQLSLSQLTLTRRFATPNTMKPKLNIGKSGPSKDTQPLLNHDWHSLFGDDLDANWFEPIPPKDVNWFHGLFIGTGGLLVEKESKSLLANFDMILGWDKWFYQKGILLTVMKFIFPLLNVGQVGSKILKALQVILMLTSPNNKYGNML